MVVYPFYGQTSRLTVWTCGKQNLTLGIMGPSITLFFVVQYVIIFSLCHVGGEWKTVLQLQRAFSCSGPPHSSQ